MTTHDIRAMGLLGCLMARPKMYTPQGTLREVLAFLEGYGAAVHYEHLRDEQREPSTTAAELAALLGWLRETAGLSRTGAMSPADLATALNRKFQDDASFFAACKAFLEERHETPRP